MQMMRIDPFNNGMNNNITEPQIKFDREETEKRVQEMNTVEEKISIADPNGTPARSNW